MVSKIQMINVSTIFSLAPGERNEGFRDQSELNPPRPSLAGWSDTWRFLSLLHGGVRVKAKGLVPSALSPLPMTLLCSCRYALVTLQLLLVPVVFVTQELTVKLGIFTQQVPPDPRVGHSSIPPSQTYVTAAGHFPDFPPGRRL